MKGFSELFIVYATGLLVAWNVYLPPKVHLGMCQLPNGQGKYTSHGTWTVLFGRQHASSFLFHIGGSHYRVTRFSQL